VSHLVPQEVALAHRDVVEATRLAGVVDGDAIVEAADDLMLEVAAVLTGRPVKGAAQRRFVDARASALTATAAELRERHQLWTEAQAEVDSISGLTLPDRTEEAHTTGGPVVALLVVVLFPMFFSWDVVVVIGRALLALVDGLALRLRMIARLALLATQGALAFLARAREVWTYLRTTLLEAALEAHHRSSSVRLRLRLQVRRARRRVRLLRAG
jgi:hypothetical protein